ncbi:hypothetical protein D3C75_1017050 [compost metagenome]
MIRPGVILLGYPHAATALDQRRIIQTTTRQRCDCRRFLNEFLHFVIARRALAIVGEQTVNLLCHAFHGVFK